MRHFAYTCCLLLITCTTSLTATPAQVIILPQAEIDGFGNLTQQGLERAGALAGFITLTTNLTKYGVPIAVYAARPTPTSPTPPFLPTDKTQACIQTVAPTAQVLKLPIHSGFSKIQDNKVASLILEDPDYDSKNVLICWRNDAIQALATALGVASPPSFPQNVYNIAWVITFAPATSLQIYSQDLLAGDTTTFCGCGSVPYPSNTGNLTPAPTLQSPEVWNFVSEPDLHPMKVAVNTFNPGTSSGLIFLAPYAFSDDSIIGQPGALIVDNLGNPVYFRPLSSPNLMNTDFRLQQLNGNPVLTFWQGTLATPPVYTNAPGGSSEPCSCYYILDNTYAVIKTVTAQNGYTSDIHEFLLTPANTALLLSTQKVPMDLTPYGGPQDGFVQDFAVQEVDLETNELLFFWNALNHIPLANSFEPASSASSTENVWDAYHLNAIGLTDDVDDIVVSGRNTWTVYRINKPTGGIVWQLGGKQSNFTIESGAEFSWQHDVRFFPGNVITLFDDNCCESDTVPPGTPPSHGLELQLNLITMTASPLTTYYHDPNITISSQGNVQTLSTSNKFIGWGQSKYYSEYAAGGNTIDNPGMNLLYDAQMPGNNYTYRAYRENWTATPYYPPSIAVASINGQTTVYASWNGSTETTSWQVFAGNSPTTLLLAGNASKTGFETVIPVASNGPYFQVKALDIGNVVIGVSSVIRQR